MALPLLNIPAIKAKIDTGARTSALHTFMIEPFEENGQMKVRFGVHPLQRRTHPEIICVADVVDQRLVSDSGGHRERRYVIKTPIRIGSCESLVEITLTNREDMMFRMLLGRTAMRKRMVVDPALSFKNGRLLSRVYSAV